METIYHGKSLHTTRDHHHYQLQKGEKVTVEMIDQGTASAWIRTLQEPYLNAIVPLSTISTIALES